MRLRTEVLSAINTLVISFSVINYVVSMSGPRVSVDDSFFLYLLLRKNRIEDNTYDSRNCKT